jgi:hypothetical protein
MGRGCLRGSRDPEHVTHQATFGQGFLMLLLWAFLQNL